MGLTILNHSPNKEIIVVDSQKLSAIQNCAWKYHLQFDRDFIPVNKADRLEAGDLVHQMLRVYYVIRMHRERQGRPHIPKKEMIKICERVGEHHYIGQNLSIGDADDAFRAFNEYVEFYWGEPHRTLAVEKVGSKVMYDSPDVQIVYEGKIDWVCEVYNQPVLPVDHKTSRRRGKVVSLANQLMGYCWLLNVRNAMVNKVGFQTSLTPAQKFERSILSYELPVLEGWVQNSIWWILHLRECYRKNEWPQNFTSCEKFFEPCIFLPICESAPELREEKLRIEFNVADKPWDVGSILEVI